VNHLPSSSYKRISFFFSCLSAFLSSCHLIFTPTYIRLFISSYIHCLTLLLSFFSHLYSAMKTWRNGTWKANLFIRPDYVMPSLLAFLLPTKGERFSHLAVDSFNAITGRTVSTDWMGRVPASVADLEEACRTQQASDQVYL
jgi:hypothetical protein